MSVRGKQKLSHFCGLHQGKEKKMSWNTTTKCLQSSLIYYVLNKYTFVPSLSTTHSSLTLHKNDEKKIFVSFNPKCTHVTYKNKNYFFSLSSYINCFALLFFLLLSLSFKTKIQYLICFPWTWHVLVSSNSRKKYQRQRKRWQTSIIRTQIHRGTEWNENEYVKLSNGTQLVD